MSGLKNDSVQGQKNQSFPTVVDRGATLTLGQLSHSRMVEY